MAASHDGRLKALAIDDIGTPAVLALIWTPTKSSALQELLLHRARSSGHRCDLSVHLRGCAPAEHPAGPHVHLGSHEANLFEADPVQVGPLRIEEGSQDSEEQPWTKEANSPPLRCPLHAATRELGQASVRTLSGQAVKEVVYGIGNRKEQEGRLQRTRRNAQRYWWR